MISIVFLIIDLVFGCKVSEEEEVHRNNKVNEQSRGEINETEMMFED